MDTLDQLKRALDTVKHNQAELRKELAQFQILQQEIEQLQHAARNNFAARQKLLLLHKELASEPCQYVRNKLATTVGKIRLHIHMLHHQFEIFPTFVPSRIARHTSQDT